MCMSYVLCVAAMISGQEGHERTIMVSHQDAGCWSVRTLAVSSDGKLLAAGAGLTIEIWDVAARKNLRSWPVPGSEASIDCLAFSPSGKILASIVQSHDTTVRLWRVADGSPIRVLTGHDAFATGVVFLGATIV